MHSDSTKSHLIAKFGHLGSDFIQQLEQHAIIKTFPADTELIKPGQFVQMIPVVLNGIVKVSTQLEEKDFLLYYIKPDQSCIMSFSSAVNQEKSRILAVSQSETTLLLIPSDFLRTWIKQYPALNLFFYAQYDLRYDELVDSIHQLISTKLDQRLVEYIKEKQQLFGGPVKMTHQEIASDLGTAREVISRLLKRLEKEKKVEQTKQGIVIL